MDNGIDAHAITEHGNCNSYAHAQLWVEDWNKKNGDRPFKYIPGVEAYFHPDLEQWARDKAAADKAKIDKKEAKLLASQQEKYQTKLIAVVDNNDETEDIDMSNALVVENEDESKSTKHFNPVNRRHHLVLLPKSQKGLLKIFSAVSESYLNGFYRFPRIDSRVLREAGKDGDIVATSACIGGPCAFSVFQELQKIKFDDMDQRLLDDHALLEKCINAVGNSYQSIVDCVGEGNYYLELQFNKLPAQNLVNRAIIEFARRSGITQQLIVTCDAHYYNPEVWKERELYKKLGFMNYAAYSPDSLPRSKDDLKCELYPKNASQVWDEYKLAKDGTNFYDDELIKGAIERTHDIAHGVIGHVPPDRTPKFPNKKLIPEGEKSFNYLVKLCKDGLIKRGLDDKQEYVDRLKEELNVIKQMKNSDYFISYQKIMALARTVVLSGPARGSGGGSLVNYVLYITDLDPIKWDLPFARFLSVWRQGAPDIDCVHENHLVIMADGRHVKAADIVDGDVVLGGDGRPHSVIDTHSRTLRYMEDAVWVLVKTSSGTLGHIVVVPGHKFVKANGDIVYCRDLRIGDVLMGTCDIEVVSMERGGHGSSSARYVDLTVEDDHRFHIIPFNVTIDNDGSIGHDTGYCSGQIGEHIFCGHKDSVYCSNACYAHAQKRKERIG